LTHAESEDKTRPEGVAILFPLGVGTLRRWDSSLLMSLVDPWSPVFCSTFFTSSNAMEFVETGRRREEFPDLPMSLMMGLHALRLQCETSLELTTSIATASCVRAEKVGTKRLYQSQFPLGSEEGAIKTLALIVPTWHIVLARTTRDTFLAACSRLSQISWYAFLMFVVSGGGNRSTDSSARRKKRFPSVLRKFQSFTGSQ